MQVEDGNFDARRRPARTTPSPHFEASTYTLTWTSLSFFARVAFFLDLDWGGDVFADAKFRREKYGKAKGPLLE